MAKDEMMASNSGRIERIEARLDRLESIVLSGRTTAHQLPSRERRVGDKPTGPSAGVRILIAQGFFDSKRTLGDVRNALERVGYHYSAQAANMALNRMSGRDGPLVALRERSGKSYAERK